MSKPFVAQLMQDIEETMFWRMEYAKRRGLKKVREVADEDQMRGYYLLIGGIPQQKHNEIFSGKIRTKEDLEKNNADYRFENPTAKTYSYLLRLTKTDVPEEFNYNIETIFL